MPSESAEVCSAVRDPAEEPATVRLAHTGPPSAADPESRQPDELQRCILWQMALCGAALDGNAVRFAMTIAEILIWSAQHAHNRALHHTDVDEVEWVCPACREPVPHNFDLCWNCETPRDAAGEWDDFDGAGEFAAHDRDEFTAQSAAAARSLQ